MASPHRVDHPGLLFLLVKREKGRLPFEGHPFLSIDHGRKYLDRGRREIEDEDRVFYQELCFERE